MDMKAETSDSLVLVIAEITVILGKWKMLLFSSVRCILTFVFTR